MNMTFNYHCICNHFDSKFVSIKILQVHVGTYLMLIFRLDMTLSIGSYGGLAFFHILYH